MCNKIILISGGMDSFISHHLWASDYTPLFIKNVSKYNHLDFKIANELFSNLEVLEAPALKEQGSGVVPYRNIILLSIVANYYEPSEIMVSAPKGELIYDQQSEYYNTLEKLLPGVKITNPIGKVTKTQAVKKFLNYYNSADLLKTRSCYSSDYKQCGNCSACLKRYIAITNNGLQEHYFHDVRAYAKTFKDDIKLSNLFKYGLVPSYEAWRALHVL